MMTADWPVRQPQHAATAAAAAADRVTHHGWAPFTISM